MRSRKSAERAHVHGNAPGGFQLLALTRAKPFTLAAAPLATSIARARAW
jgi:hypothetical protein